MLASLLRRAAPFAIPLSLMVGVAACGGGGSGTVINIPIAFEVIGQSNFTNFEANYGTVNNSGPGATVNAMGFASPLGGIATNGTLFYVADYSNNRVLGWTSIPTNSTTPPNFVLGQSSFTTNASGDAANQLALPSSVTISDNNELVVADTGNNRVLIWKTLPTSSGVAADLVIGQPGFNSSSASTSADLSGANMASPADARLEKNILFVSDTQNNRVLIWNPAPTTNGAAANIVLGQLATNTNYPAFESSTLIDVQGSLTNPAGLWTDGLRLLVSDSGDNRVMYWQTIPTTTGQDATYEIGQTDFTRNTAGVGQASLRTPYGVTSDGNSVFIADIENNRVLAFDSFPLSNGASASVIFGQNTASARAANDDNQDGTPDANPTDRVFSSPTGVTAVSGVLYVTDRNNNRVLLFASNDTDANN